MSISSAITAAQGRVADCYTSVNTMGGTLPVTQNLTNLPAAIESIPQGGGDTVYAANHTGSTPNVGDKVILNLGINDSTNNLDYQYSTSGGYNPVLFLDSNMFVTSFGSSTYRYSYINGEWVRNNANSSYGSDFGKGTLYNYHDNNVISADCWYNQEGYNKIVTSSGAIDVVSSGTGSQYLGEYNGVHYIAYGYENAVYTYDTTTNTKGTRKLDAASRTSKGFLSGSYGFLWNNAGLVDRFSIDGSGNFDWAGATSVSTALYPLFITGATTGHYIFVTSVITSNYISTTNATTTSSPLFIYQVQSNGTLKQVHIPELLLFETTPCLISYDSRNEVLCVGTKDNVYFYQFDDDDFSFTLIPLAFDLTENETTYAYYPFMSPDKKKVVILTRTASNGFSVNAYVLGGALNEIVSNSTYNYMPDNSFTGFITGNTDESGNYEVSTVLPEVREVSITTDLDADEVEVLGGAE